jgi:predicted Zn-dependent peptidase
LISEKSTSVSLLSHILGDGSSSRLFQRLREKNGIAYQINSFVNFFKDVSSFGVYFSTKDQSVERARELIIKEFKKLRNKRISEKELNRAKEYLKGNILISLESTTNRMMRIANSLIYYGKVKTIDESIKKIDEVTTNDIFLLSNELLNEDKFNTVVISSKNHLLQSAA